MELHVLPKLGKVPIADIDQIDIRDTLAPIWHDKAETASKAMDRLGICLKHAAALGLDVDLQATMKARALLGKQRHKPKKTSRHYLGQMFQASRGGHAAGPSHPFWKHGERSSEAEEARKRINDLIRAHRELQKRIH